MQLSIVVSQDNQEISEENNIILIKKILRIKIVTSKKILYDYKLKENGIYISQTILLKIDRYDISYKVFNKNNSNKPKSKNITKNTTCSIQLKPICTIT